MVPRGDEIESKENLSHPKLGHVHVVNLQWKYISPHQRLGKMENQQREMGWSVRSKAYWFQLSMYVYSGQQTINNKVFKETIHTATQLLNRMPTYMYTGAVLTL